MKRIFRSVFALLLVCCTLLAIPATAMAAGGTVTYDGKAQKFIFGPGGTKSPTDLFPGFKDVMPGDKLTDQIVIKNTGLFSKHIRVYIRAKGGQQNTDDFLSQMTLTVKQIGKTEDKELFQAPADETAQLKDWVFLGTVYSRGEITLEVTLNVPIEMDNDFANRIGYLDWEFKVEEIPHEGPKTGDTSHILLLTVVMTASLAALVVLFVFSRKRKAR